MKWDQAVGLTGKAQITKDKGNKDDVYFNHVKEWLEPEEGDNEWN